MSRTKFLIMCVTTLVFAAQTTFAQPAGAVRGSAGTGFVGKHAQDQLAALRDPIEVDDAEWKKLSPKIEKVIVAKQNMNSGAGMQWTSSNNAKPVFKAAEGKPATPAGKAMQAVRDAVADIETPADELTKKIAAARLARQKARAEHEAAMLELIDALTPRQQAILMTFGVVE
jgi:Spy/CpxP family protein refolding chaperone